MDIIGLPVRICRCGRYNQISIHLLGMRCGNDIESRTGQDKAFCAQSQYGALWGRDISAQTCKKNNQEDCESFTILARKIFENGKTFVQWRNICHEAMWHHVSKSVLELLIEPRDRNTNYQIDVYGVGYAVAIEKGFDVRTCAMFSLLWFSRIRWRPMISPVEAPIVPCIWQRVSETVLRTRAGGWKRLVDFLYITI